MRALPSRLSSLHKVGFPNTITSGVRFSPMNFEGCKHCKHSNCINMILFMLMNRSRRGKVILTERSVEVYSWISKNNSLKGETLQCPESHFKFLTVRLEVLAETLSEFQPCPMILVETEMDSGIINLVKKISK